MRVERQHAFFLPIICVCELRTPRAAEFSALAPSAAPQNVICSLPGRETQPLWRKTLSTVREITYEILRKAGMNIIFGNPGSTELPFLRDMPPDFKYVLGLHERAAAGMGLGYAMATGKAAFVNLHSIASSGNGLSSLVDAWYGHVPLIVTTGQQDRRQLLSEPFLGSHAVETVRPYVKWAYEPVRAEDVPAAIVQAITLRFSPRWVPYFSPFRWMTGCTNASPRKFATCGGQFSPIPPRSMTWCAR